MSEHHIIKKYFQSSKNSTIALGIGDDAAIFNVPQEKQLVVSMDTLNEGVHFFADTNAADIGYKALAVNLSDMAAMGAEPKWITMSLSLPEMDETWLEHFMQGFNELANQYAVELIGGDLCKGAMSITVQAHGLVDKDKSLTRSNAKVGDRIYVSGELGAAGLAYTNKKVDKAISEDDLLRLNRPIPRLELGQALIDKATSCIDLSDGLANDLQHVVTASDVGAKLFADELPLANSLKELEQDKAFELGLCAGDDYELCFTLPNNLNTKLLQNFNIKHIGEITAEKKLVLLDAEENEIPFEFTGYQHF